MTGRARFAPCLTRGAALGAALALLLSAPATSGDSAVTGARDAAAELDAAILALEAAVDARARIDGLTRTIRAQEAGLARLRDSLRQVVIREDSLRRDLENRRDRVARLLGVMSSMERTSGPQLLLHPSGPVGTARSGMILSEITPALQAEADNLRATLQELSALRKVQEDASRTLEDGLRTLQEARVALSQAVAERRDLPQRLTESPEALRRLAESVDTLTAFADLLLDTRLAPEETVRSFSSARGYLPLPVRGRVVRGFDLPDGAGPGHPGLVIAAEPRALVTVPWAATLRFRGPLLDYGNVIILEPEDGYLLVMAGLGEVYGETGEVLPPGAPIGMMAGNEKDTAGDELRIRSGGTATLSESLYIELRRDNLPVDPAEWFALTRE